MSSKAETHVSIAHIAHKLACLYARLDLQIVEALRNPEYTIDAELQAQAGGASEFCKKLGLNFRDRESLFGREYWKRYDELHGEAEAKILERYRQPEAIPYPVSSP